MNISNSSKSFLVSLVIPPTHSFSPHLQATTNMLFVGIDQFEFSRILNKQNHIVCVLFLFAFCSSRELFHVYQYSSFIFVIKLYSIIWIFHNTCAYRYDSAILLLDIYSREMKAYVQLKLCIQIFLRSLFALAKKWKQSKCPSAVDHSGSYNELRNISFSIFWKKLY